MPTGERNADMNRARALQKHAAQEGNYTVDVKTGCWKWQGGVDTDGYGKLKRDGKTIRAHRFFYELLVAPIPKGLVVCHRCDNPCCVNPAHLFIGSHADNERDKDAKGRRPPSPSITHPETLARGGLHHKAKLTEEQVRSIRNSERTNRELATEYNVHITTIQRAKSKKFWTHV